MKEREPQSQALAALLADGPFPSEAYWLPEPRLLPVSGLSLVELANQPRVVIDLQALLPRS